ncbi:MAG: hypothetical protein WA040_03465 [Anaerolineae bacterium]
MQASASERYVQQISDLARGLPEEKLRKVLAFVRKVKEEPPRPMAPLTSQEIIALANERAAELRRQSRPQVEAQYQSLVQALQAEIEAKNISVEDFPRGD